MLSKLLKIRYFNIEVDAEGTNKTKAKSLELIIDGHLSWAKFVDEISRKISSPVSPKETAVLIFITKLYSCITLTIIIFVVLSAWGDCNLALSNKLQKRQKLIGLPW